MNEIATAIVEAAEQALDAPEGFERAPGYCARWVRQTLALVPGVLHPPSGLDAREQFKWFQARGMAIRRGEKLLPGDVAYKIALSQGKHGHVGIVVMFARVAENSSCHSRNGSDARGRRSIGDFGNVTGIVRLWHP